MTNLINSIFITYPCDWIAVWFVKVFHRIHAPCYGRNLSAGVSGLLMVDRNGHFVTDLQIHSNKLNILRIVSIYK